jgi:hypothetical protein
MKAQIDNQVIADNDDIVERGGYQYFPAGAVRALKRDEVRLNRPTLRSFPRTRESSAGSPPSGDERKRVQFA